MLLLGTDISTIRMVIPRFEGRRNVMVSQPVFAPLTASARFQSPEPETLGSVRTDEVAWLRG